MNPTEVRFPDSFWAAVTPQGPALPQLAGAAEADVVVVGAGFTGLSVALHLREAGIDVAVIEAAEPGWGASGRNNGQVIPTLSRPDPDDIVAKHGAAGERFVAMLRDSADRFHRAGIERIGRVLGDESAVCLDLVDAKQLRKIRYLPQGVDARSACLRGHKPDC